MKIFCNESLQPATRKSVTYYYIWMSFFNGIIASAISFYLLNDFINFEPSLNYLYIWLQQIGHFQFFSLLSITPAILISLLIPSKRLSLILSSLIFSLFILLVFIDYSIFQLYKFHINGMVWNMLTGGALTEIFVFDLSNITTAIAILMAIIVIQILLFKLASQCVLSPKNKGIWLFLTIFSIQFSGQLIYAVASAQQNTNIISLTQFIPSPLPLTMNRFLYKNGWVIKAGKRLIQTQTEGRFNYPINPIRCNNLGTLPNIIFIVIDGLRFDMVNKIVMPNWHQLKQSSQVFNHHLSTGNATRFGIFGLFTGLFSNYWFDALNTQMKPVFISELLKHDYQFGFFANARLTRPEFDQAIFSQVRDDIPEKTEGENVIAREYKITRQTQDFFTLNKNRPFFSFTFFDAPHAYQYPEQDAKFSPTDEAINYLKLSNDSNTQSFLNRYKNAVYFDDRLTGQLIKNLKENDIFDNSIIILTGDHGQEANETKTNSWGHNSNFSKYQIQVPLLIHWPNKTPKTYTHLSSHADVIPTLMKRVFNCSNPVSDYSSGQSLFNTKERNFVLVNNWNNQAMVNKDVVRVFHKLRRPVNRQFDNYELLNDEVADSTLDIEILKTNSRFYR